MIAACWDLGWGLMSHGFDDGGMHLLDLVFGGWILGMPILLAVTALMIARDIVSDSRARRRRNRQAAMRRHPSARESRYHESNQWGR